MRVLGSLQAISCVIYATNVLASAPGSLHGDGLVQRSAHKAIARDARLAAVPPTLRRKSTKKRDGTIQRRCRVRPSTSSSVASPTTTLQTTTTTSTRSSTASTDSSTASVDNHVPNSPWKLQWTSAGRSFFDEWSFWSDGDPTHGTVAFQDRDSAFNRGLVYVDGDGYAFMKADTSQYVDNRASIRIHSNHVFSGNTIMLMDSVHMPVGCGEPYSQSSFDPFF